MPNTIKPHAKLVSARDLAAHVDKAVDLAAKRLSITPDPHTVITRWDLVGRILRDLDVAQKFAHEVSASLDKSVGPTQPAVLVIDKMIIAGFVEREFAAPMRNLS